MANGMWCSASSRMASASSFWLTRGSGTRLTIESRPETETTALLAETLALPTHSLMAS